MEAASPRLEIICPSQSSKKSRFWNGNGEGDVFSKEEFPVAGDMQHLSTAGQKRECFHYIMVSDE